jgi:hypothetical protein
MFFSPALVMICLTDFCAIHLLHAGSIKKINKLRDAFKKYIGHHLIVPAYIKDLIETVQRKKADVALAMMAMLTGSASLMKK